MKKNDAENIRKEGFIKSIFKFLLKKYIFLIISLIFYFSLVIWTCYTLYPNWKSISNLKVPDKYLITSTDISSPEFHNDQSIQLGDKELIKKIAFVQYNYSSAFIFLLLILLYIFHVFFLLPNLLETIKDYKEYAVAIGFMPHLWYLLIIIIAFPLALAVIPEFSTNYNVFKPELLSKVVLSILSNLIVILLTAELSTLYYSIDQDKIYHNIGDIIKKVFNDIRLKQLITAIVLDVITFYFVSRLPSLKQRLNFNNVLDILLIITAISVFFSSFGAIYTLSTNEKIKNYKGLENKKSN